MSFASVVLMILAGNVARAQQAPTLIPEDPGTFKQEGEKDTKALGEAALKYYAEQGLKFLGEKDQKKQCDYLKKATTDYLNMPMSTVADQQQAEDEVAIKPVAVKLSSWIVAHDKSGELYRALVCVGDAMNADKRADRHVHIEYLNDILNQKFIPIMTEQQKIATKEALVVQAIGFGGGMLLPEGKSLVNFSAKKFMAMWIERFGTQADEAVTKFAQEGAAEFNAGLQTVVDDVAPKQAAQVMDSVEKVEAQVQAQLPESLTKLRAAGFAAGGSAAPFLHQLFKYLYQTYLVNTDKDPDGNPILRKDIIDYIDIDPLPASPPTKKK